MLWKRRQNANKIRQNRERHSPAMRLPCGDRCTAVIERGLLASERKGAKLKKLLDVLKLARVQRLSDSVANVDDTRVTHSFGTTSCLEPGYVDVPT